MRYDDINREKRNEICQEIEFNVSQEALAREYYYKLLNKVGEEHQEAIKGIIEDEINHSIILMRLAEIYSGNKPTEFENLLYLKKKEE